MDNTSGVSLVAAIRDPLRRDHENQHLEAGGHLCLYRFMAEQGQFLRATVPSGAASPVFQPLAATDMVPVEEWVPVGERPLTPLRLVEGSR
jgi:hypothetical protein